MTETDIVDTAAGLSPGSPVAALRRQREAFVRHTQGSHDVLITPADATGLSLVERACAALCVASIERDAALIAHYRSRLAELGADAAVVAAAGGRSGMADVPLRLATILDHVRLVATAPATATRARLDTLRDAGLTPRDIVTLAQVVAFVSYQVRIVAGLRALSQDVHA